MKKLLLCLLPLVMGCAGMVRQPVADNVIYNWRCNFYEGPSTNVTQSIDGANAEISPPISGL